MKKKYLEKRKQKLLDGVMALEMNYYRDMFPLNGSSAMKQKFMLAKYLISRMK